MSSSDLDRMRATPERHRAEREAIFVSGVKSALLRAAADQGVTLTELARRIGRHKSAVSRALDLDSNIELMTMFSLADALGMQWSVALKSIGAETPAAAETRLPARRGASGFRQVPRPSPVASPPAKRGSVPAEQARHRDKTQAPVAS